jgi:hypothetical protein
MLCARGSLIPCGWLESSTHMAASAQWQRDCCVYESSLKDVAGSVGWPLERWRGFEMVEAWGWKADARQVLLDHEEPHGPRRIFGDLSGTLHPQMVALIRGLLASHSDDVFPNSRSVSTLPHAVE